jgi:hypothetical protein
MPTRKEVGAWLDGHPIIWHAIVGAPISAAITAYMLRGGAGWLWSLYGGVFGVLIAATFQEWADQRAHDAIEEHHALQIGPKRVTDMTAVAAGERVQQAEVWHGWDWRDFAGFAIGAQVGSVLAVVIL